MMGDKVEIAIKDVNPWDLLADKYLEHFGEEGNFSHKHIIEPALMEMIGDVNGKLACDIGCATGNFTRKLARMGAKVVGLDLSIEMLKLANSKNEKIIYIRADLEDKLPFNDSTFDMISQIMVLHSLENIDNAIKETARILKPQGEAYIVLPHPSHIKGFRSLEDVDEAKYITAQKAAFTWKEFSDACDIPTNFFIRSFQDYINTFYDNGLIITKTSEPIIQESALKDLNGVRTMDVYNRLREMPLFIIFRLQKTHGG
jgi:ubiquinone/menaquinone biosynthesis C-methylase UbiE